MELIICLHIFIIFKCVNLGFHFEGEEIPLSRSSSSSRDVDFESGRDVSSTETPSGVLQDIAMKCGTKVIGTNLHCRRNAADYDL